MDSAERVLVIILSGTLALFLTLAIVVAIKVIQVMNQIKRITEKAEALAEKAGSVASFFKNAAAPVAIGRLLAGMAETIFGEAKRKKRKRA
jgi:hypothetical protein